MIEEGAEYDFWVKFLLFFPFLVLFAFFLSIFIGIVEEDSKAELILIRAMILILTTYWLILPRKYRIRDGRLEIVMGFVYKVKISDIEEIRRDSWKKMFFFKGLRFATSKNIIEIRKKSGLSLVISPKNADLFLEYLKSAIQQEREKDE
ncbi:MAG: PH domain-containing protein [Archaeoglobaceae archaeon]|nr:PH domain-containing protein [Archaeoglobaceae archaeon]MDW7989942.1 PH domain-containing protein [Archaeoglobaceae archaeon]